jgi:hypothetical protein
MQWKRAYRAESKSKSLRSLKDGFNVTGKPQANTGGCKVSDDFELLFRPPPRRKNCHSCDPVPDPATFQTKTEIGGAIMRLKMESLPAQPGCRGRSQAGTKREETRRTVQVGIYNSDYLFH